MTEKSIKKQYLKDYNEKIIMESFEGIKYNKLQDCSEGLVATASVAATTAAAAIAAAATAIAA